MVYIVLRGGEHARVVFLVVNGRLLTLSAARNSSSSASNQQKFRVSVIVGLRLMNDARCFELISFFFSVGRKVLGMPIGMVFTENLIWDTVIQEGYSVTTGIL